MSDDEQQPAVIPMYTGRKWRYDYVAPIRVIDGDTVKVLIDAGFGLHIEQTFRLYGIDAPETHGKTSHAGVQAAGALQTLLHRGIAVLETYRPDKYGRPLCRIWVGDPDTGDFTDVNQWMVYNGYARMYLGGAK
jgi:endonuclease YncB( thermonuclease family)